MGATEAGVYIGEWIFLESTRGLVARSTLKEKMEEYYWSDGGEPDMP